jgi:uncharacterized protein (TIGR03437 family)
MCHFQRTALGLVSLFFISLLLGQLLGQPPVAPPAILQHGIVNAASRMPPDVPGGSIARGSLFTIYGVRLGPETPALGEVALRFTNGAETIDAQPVFASYGRIDAIMPPAVPLGSVSLTVSYRGLASVPHPVNVVAASFGIFTHNGRGWGPAVIPADHAQAGAPLRPGEIAAVEGTGLGDVRNRDAEVLVGGQRAPWVDAKHTSEPGHDVVRFRIPRNTPIGCWVPIQVRLGPLTSNTATLAVARKGRPCPAADNAIVREAALGGQRGLMLLLRSTIRVELGSGGPQDFTNDEFDAFFQRLRPRSGMPSLIDLIPPPGTCTSYAITTQLAKLAAALPIGDALRGGTPLDAGEKLMLSGPLGTREIGKARPHGQSFSQHLGGREIGVGKPTPLFLKPGEYVVDGQGGNDIGPFHASIEFPTPAVWSNEEEITEIDRARGVSLYWTGTGKTDLVAILGVNLDQVTSATAVSVCLAEPGTHEFKIPPSALSNFPASRQVQAIPSNLLGMVVIPTAVERFQAKGLEGGMASWADVTIKAVPFR